MLRVFSCFSVKDRNEWGNNSMFSGRWTEPISKLIKFQALWLSQKVLVFA